MEYDRASVLEAWKKAVNNGVIETAVLRPEIARAWARCMAMGVDPWSSDFSKHDDETLAKMRRKYASVIEASSPVLQYLLTVFNCNASLADMHGFVFELVTPLSAYPRTLGTYVNEALTGNGNITMVIQERKPFRVDGYEHFRAISQNYSGAAAPVHLGKQDFVLCLNDPFSVLPKNALDLCVAAARLIEKLHVGRREVFSHLSSATFFDPLLNSDALAILVTDQDGMILTANALARKAVAGFEKFPYASRSLAEYLKNKQELSSLLNESSGMLSETEVAFRGGRGRNVSMKFLRRRNVKLANGHNHCILIFESPVETAPAEAAPLLRDSTENVECIGQSPQWQRVDQLVHNVAAHRSNVMITGATGTGKEVVARMLHRLSGRKGEFVAINCGALPRELLASELFGYEGGAFTGARSSGAKGKFEYANGGTLFLDEIGDMPLDMQVSLLRVLQEQSVTRIGANNPIPINIRVIAATNQNLQRMVAEGKFRSDLWYRLSVIEISLPPLREREGDIRLLANFFNENLSESLSVRCLPLSEDVLGILEAYDWPGNVRELKNVMEKALIIANGGPITAESLPDYIRSQGNPPQKPRVPLTQKPTPPDGNHHTVREDRQPSASSSEHRTGKQIREEMEKERITKVLEEEMGNISRAAKRLNISRNTLYRKIERMNIRLKVQAMERPASDREDGF